ncbi:MAG: TRAM domain-containing protein [Actinobacteria bacterium]|nr:TRAM domain-containing protein [Actinomycetota bacterium]
MTELQHSQPSRAPRAPVALLEVLRLLVVVFFAGAGYSLGSGIGPSRPVLGALNGTALGVVLGSGLGYVLGGVLVAWPVFFLPQPYLAFPLFGFVVVVLGYFGFVVGASKRDGVLALFGERAGMAPRPTPASALPRVLDSSVAIDGRIVDVVRAGFLHGQLLVPTPVLAELQGLADAGDDLRRSRGRRGLEVLETLQREPGVDVEALDLDVPGVAEVDAKLVRICLDRGAALLTLDTNLAKAAQLAGVQVLNLHALALALRPPVAAGDDVPVLLLKAGKEAGQAVGYLDDGSMVVVERARERIGSEVPVRVTSVLTTANGRLVFGRPADEAGAPAVSLRGRRPSPATVAQARKPG